MTTTRELVVDIPRALWLSSNQRLHWATKNERTQGLRSLGKYSARAVSLGRLGRCLVTAHVGYPPTVNRADPDNAHPTTKALIDGLRDAGVWPDDDPRFVAGVGHQLDAEGGTGKAGWYRIRLTFEPVGGDS